eukprot:333504-Chlamydomonas_euryale.AAC.2
MACATQRMRRGVQGAAACESARMGTIGTFPAGVRQCRATTAAEGFHSLGSTAPRQRLQRTRLMAKVSLNFLPSLEGGGGDRRRGCLRPGAWDGRASARERQNHALLPGPCQRDHAAPAAAAAGAHPRRAAPRSGCAAAAPRRAA